MLKQNFFILSLIIMPLIKITAQSNQTFNLIPYPSILEVQNGLLRIDENFSLELNFENPRLQYAANRFLRRLSDRTGIFLSESFALINSGAENTKMFVSADEYANLELGMNESYEIIIGNGRIKLISKTDIGILRGFETILQLIQADSVGYYLPNLKIIDSPRFIWRGLMIDVCRHFMPIDVIKRNIDGMAAVKMNVLHLHLSEDQGFRVESKIYPKLHELGSDGLYYTQEQIKDIVKYAGDRGVRVVPEFDVPGHATAIITAYPELASLPGEYEIERSWGVFNPTLNPIKEETYIFLHNLFSEMSELFPDNYFHIGGDENNGKQWDENQEIQAFMRDKGIEDNHALQAFFNSKLSAILKNLDKKMVGWDEILSADMPNNIVIQSWRGKDAMVEAAKKGYQTILSNGYYIDLIQPTDFHYMNDPRPKNIGLSEDERKFVLGGEATMWAEMISHETIDSRIWPRTAAIAERLWSPEEINNIESMYKRLEKINILLEEHGLTHIKNTDMMLRRMAGSYNIQPIKNLLSVIEPVKGYKRNQLRKQTQQSPLTRIVDAATPDAASAREFRNAVDEYISYNSSDAEFIIIKMLTEWKENHSQLIQIIDKSPMLFEIKPMAENLHFMSELGLEIIEKINGKKSFGGDWLVNAEHKLEIAREPVAQTELMIVSAIDKLLKNIK